MIPTTEKDSTVFVEHNYTYNTMLHSVPTLHIKAKRNTTLGLFSHPKTT